MKKLFLTALFTVSGFAFAHCGSCGTEEKSKSCGAVDSQCSSENHDQSHNKRHPSTLTQEEPAEPQGESQSETKENTEQ